MVRAASTAARHASRRSALARARRRARLPLPDHPDDRFGPGPRGDPRRRRPARHRGHRVPRLPDLVPRRRAPRPPVVLRAVRASRRGRSAWTSAKGSPAGWPRRVVRPSSTSKPSQDPRVKYFPEFEEERFQSLVSVPVFGRDGERHGGHLAARRGAPRVRPGRSGLPGTHRLADRRSGRERPTVRGDRGAGRSPDRPVQPAAADRRRADDRGRVLHGLRRHARALERRSRGGLPLRRRRSASGSARRTRRDATTGRSTRGRSGTTSCETAEPADPRARGISPRRSGARTLRPARCSRRSSRATSSSDCLVVSVPAPVPGADTALSAVAAHTAVTIKQHQLIERLQETNVVKDFFRALASGEAPDAELEAMAERLGLRPATRTISCVHVEPWRGASDRSGRRRPGRVDDDRTAAWRDVAGRSRRSLDARIGALSDRGRRSLHALVRSAIADTSADVVGRLASDVVGRSEEHRRCRSASRTSAEVRSRSAGGSKRPRPRRRSAPWSAGSPV